VIWAAGTGPVTVSADWAAKARLAVWAVRANCAVSAEALWRA
jgi:hypothetical protein